MSYYSDERITFREAEQAVARYIEEHRTRRTRVSSKDVANAEDIEQVHHNLIRLNSALAEELDVARKSSAKATQYHIP